MAGLAADHRHLRAATPAARRMLYQQAVILLIKRIST
jgi:hypothetical protein